MRPARYASRPASVACRDMRMNLGQGYYFSRGLAAHELFRIPRAQVPAECQFVKLNLLR